MTNQYQRTLRTARKLTFLALLLGSLLVPSFGQRALTGETRMRLMLQELNNVGSVMMIAAHPDDENNALIAYLSRGRHVRTAYLSLTRGEGGQNLIGSEQGDELGIIRTQELLAEHRMEGAEQYFTRAIDFGFTKTAEETLSTKWPREKVLGDVVWQIRRFRPDVIILQFTGTPRDGHGQHQASAILGKEAFSAAADPRRFPEQLKYVQPWQAKRLMTNVRAGFGTDEKELEKIPDKLVIDVGAYDPALGYSFGEIGGQSRSMHRSQGMGSLERRGEIKNYLVTDVGDKAKTDIFEGLNLTWSRFEGGAPITALLDQALASFQPTRMESLLDQLTKVRPLMAAVATSSNEPIAARKLRQLDEAIALSAGLWAEAIADKHSVTPGGTVKVTLTALSRSPAQVTLLGAKLSGMEGIAQPQIAAAILAANKASQYPVNVNIPETQSYTQPYWLQLPKDASMYTVSDPEKTGDAENEPLLKAEFRFSVRGTEILLTRPVEHRYVDRVYGELMRPLAVVPPVALDFGGTPIVFADSNPRRVEVPIKSNTGKVAGDVRLVVPAGWRYAPEVQHFELGGANEQTVLAFDLTPPASDSQGVLRAVARVADREIAVNTKVIDYPHFPVQTLFPPSDAKLVRVELKNLSKNIGYVMGAGDEVPEALRQMGTEVTLLTKDDLTRGDLSRFDAIVTGVRAWNVRADLRANYQRLFRYVEDGGTLIVQYNVAETGPPGAARPNTSSPNGAQGRQTPNGDGAAAPAGDGGASAPVSPFTGMPLDTTALDHIGPYPIKESRDPKERVTVEEAPVKFPNPQVSLLHFPNEITEKDFEGWVQERGLNFAIEWDPRYISILETHDPGERPLLGGQLYTKYGKGAYIFTGYSWFRQLPAGVPGAYRFFANMLSAGKAAQ